MNILVAHNFYQIPGGEDQVYKDEAALLESHGHAVTRFAVHNDDLKSAGKLAMAKMTVWNGTLAKRLAEVAYEKKIDVAHFTNTFPQISPAAYYAVRRTGAAVVQSLHNYRFICPSALFLRDGNVCESCMGKLIPLPAIKHGCYRESKSASAVVAGMLTFHRLLGTYRRAVDAYIPLTDFGKQKFIQAGLPTDKLHVKPNFVSPDPGHGDGDGGYAIFVGRLSAEKGVDVLLRAWENAPGIKLKIVGDGPLADRVIKAAARSSDIEWLGRRPVEQVMELVGRASCLIFPSVWYEGLPKTIIEAFAKGTPVIASKVGAMIDLIRVGETGVQVPAGDPAALAAAVLSLHADPVGLRAMRQTTRQAFLSRYTADANYERLMSIYDAALAVRSGKTLAPQLVTSH